MYAVQLMSRPARIAVTGYMHEANALAAPLGLHDGLEVSQTPGGLAASWEAGAAIARLKELGGVEVHELPVWEFGAGGPLHADAFAAVLGGTLAALRAVGTVEGVLVLGHGAGRTTDHLDPDAEFLAAIRHQVGPDVPVVVVLDFHANVSPEMCDHADALVGYRTNPHTDVVARTVEAAELLHSLLDGTRTAVVMCRPPMVLPQLAQNTLPGEPLADVMQRAELLMVGPVRNVSVFGGFSLADVPACGVSVCATVQADAVGAGVSAAEELAAAIWERRHRFRLRATPLAHAVAEAVRADRGLRGPVLLADTADNPGGGAPGTSTAVLAALLDAGVHSAVLGLQCDPAVVSAAWAAGVGAQIDVTFNSGSEHPPAAPLRVRATVLELVEGALVPTKGVYAGSTRHAGRCCALDIDGVRVGVSSHKVQCADDDTLLHVGLRPEDVRVVVVKSRGHFRAGFSHLFEPDQIIEVDAPGVAPAGIDSLVFTTISRPVFPLDEVEAFVPHTSVHVGSCTGLDAAQVAR